MENAFWFDVVKITKVVEFLDEDEKEKESIIDDVERKMLSDILPIIKRHEVTIRVEYQWVDNNVKVIMIIKDNKED